MTIGFGLVGCGGAAVDLATAIDKVPGVGIVAAFDRRIENAEDLARPRGARVHEDLASLLADDAIDIVYVGVPHDLLAPTATQAIEAGRHVLVEKPMALTVDGIRDVGRAAATRGVLAGVVFETRYVAAFRAARDLVESGSIGSVRAIRIQTVIDKPARYWQSGASGRVADDWRAHRERAGGGVVLMNSIHQLDVVRWLTGREFVRAIGDVALAGDGVDVEDRAAAALRLDDDTLVSMTATASSRGATDQERIEIDGTHGRLDLPDPYSDDPAQLYLGHIWEGLASGRWHPIDPDPVDPYVPFIEAVARAVTSGADMPATTEDAAAALATVLAIYESAATGRSVDIDMPR